MCFGVPMQIKRVEGLVATCEGAGRIEQVTLVLTGALPVGAHVLVYLGSAVRELDALEAAQIGDAIMAIGEAAEGRGFDHLIQDLIDREPELPAHLRTQAARPEDTHDTPTPADTA